MLNKIIISLVTVAIVVTLIGAAVVFRGPSIPRSQIVVVPSNVENTQPVEEPIPVVHRPRTIVPLEPDVTPTPATSTIPTRDVVPAVIPTPTLNIPSHTTFVIKTAASSTKLTSLIWWHPNLNTKFQIQFATALDSSIDADAYDLDLFDTPKEIITALHAKGKRVICYMSAGSWEDWRPDKDAFSKAVIGKDYQGWPGENWLDVRRVDLLGPIMQARFDLANSKGCDAIDPDNMDVYNVDSGFPITYADQITYNKWLAAEAHKRGLSIGLKNDTDQLPDLLSSFDWTLLEDCHTQGWCAQVEPFVKAGKAVFQIEYLDDGAKLADFCPESKQLNFNAVLKHRNLDAWVQRCP